MESFILLVTIPLLLTLVIINYQDYKQNEEIIKIDNEIIKEKTSLIQVQKEMIKAQKIYIEKLEDKLKKKYE